MLEQRCSGQSTAILPFYHRCALFIDRGKLFRHLLSFKLITPFHYLTNAMETSYKILWCLLGRYDVWLL
jgi:hypothetical protein